MDNLRNNTGTLRFFITDENFLPIQNASIQISSTGSPDNIITRLMTDESGNSETATLNAPPVAYSMEPTDNQPYAVYNARINADGYNEMLISAIQLMADENYLQQVVLTPAISGAPPYNPVVIDAHTLWEYYPPKIAEAEVKPVNESGEIVLSRVVIPETIVVHDGAPTDTTAKDYYVPYIDYIKNVASCEIYSTWPTETIKANVLAIMSFTLNRVYTEW